MFKHLKVGDIAIRGFCGIKQKWMVTEVTPELITIGMGWTFDPETGAEIDDELQYGPKYGRTISYLLPEWER